jgi:hypothetical protein
MSNMSCKHLKKNKRKHKKYEDTNNEEEITCQFCGYKFCDDCSNDYCVACRINRSEDVPCPKCSMTIYEFGENICISCFAIELVNGELLYCNDCKEFGQKPIWMDGKITGDMDDDDKKHMKHDCEKNKKKLVGILYKKYPDAKNSSCCFDELYKKNYNAKNF